MKFKVTYKKEDYIVKVDEEIDGDVSYLSGKIYQSGAQVGVIFKDGYPFEHWVCYEDYNGSFTNEVTAQDPKEAVRLYVRLISFLEENS